MSVSTTTKSCDICADEATSWVTPRCSHEVCLECYTKLVAAGNQYQPAKCPMCRQVYVKPVLTEREKAQRYTELDQVGAQVVEMRRQIERNQEFLRMREQTLARMEGEMRDLGLDPNAERPVRVYARRARTPEQIAFDNAEAEARPQVVTPEEHRALVDFNTWMLQPPSAEREAILTNGLNSNWPLVRRAANEAWTENETRRWNESEQGIAANAARREEGAHPTNTAVVAFAEGDPYCPGCHQQDGTVRPQTCGRHGDGRRRVLRRCNTCAEAANRQHTVEREDAREN